MGGEGCSKEPELNPDQNIEVRDRELQVAGRLKYFLLVWMDNVRLRNILDMVEHCHLEFTENPYQQYPKPPIKFNSEEAAIVDGEYNNCLVKGFWKRLTLLMAVSMSLPFSSGKRKMVLTD